MNYRGAVLFAAMTMLIVAAGCRHHVDGQPARKAAGPEETEPAPVPATTGKGGVTTHYMRGSKANVVYSARDLGSGLESVEIWISSDGGKTWKKYAEDSKLTGRVLFKADEEGSFDVVSVGVDRIGNRETELNATSRPDFRVVVDRTPPKLTASGPAEGVLAPFGSAFEFSWEATDPHLAQRPVDVEVRYKKDPVWSKVRTGLDASGRGRFEIKEVADDVAEIRFVARDLAGNVGYARAGTAVFDRLAPVGKVTGPAVAEGLNATVTYSVSDPGQAELASVEVWITANNGRSWRKLTDAPVKAGKVDVRLPHKGVFGLSISARDSVGNALKAPGRGTKPQFVLSTDIKAPGLKATSWVKKGQVVSAQKGVTLKWAATDTNLGAAPVVLEFSSDGGRSWSEVGKALSREGSFDWKPADNINSKKCMLRLVARDVLGNESVVNSPTFIVDNNPPSTEATFKAIDDEAPQVGPQPEPGRK